jgi:serine/threonine protein kinase
MASQAKKVGFFTKAWKKYVPDKAAQERYKIAMENGLGPKFTTKGNYYYFEDLSRNYVPFSQIQKPTLDQVKAVLNASNKLHLLGVVHSDLHVDNIFINETTSDVKFIDFDSCLTGKCNDLSFAEASHEELRNFPYINDVTGESEEGPPHFLLGAPDAQKEFASNDELKHIYYCETCNLPVVGKN